MRNKQKFTEYFKTNFIDKTWNILKDTFKFIQEDEPVVYCAAIAFFTIFSLPAILIVITLIASMFFAEEEVRIEIIDQVNHNINEEAGKQVEVVLENAVNFSGNIWWILIGILIIVKSASMIFFIMQKALNSIWKVDVKKKVNYMKLMKHRIKTLALVAGLGVLLVASLLADTVISFFGSYVAVLWEGFSKPLIKLLSIAFNLLTVLTFFTTILKMLPDVKITWKDALAGGTITSVLFLIGKEIINLILKSIEIDGYYATAGSLVIILLWVFYSSIIFFLGAELTKAYVLRQGREIQPSSIAIKYSIKTRQDNES